VHLVDLRRISNNKGFATSYFWMAVISITKRACQNFDPFLDVFLGLVVGGVGDRGETYFLGDEYLNS